jgi:hypothetical protein
MRKLVVLLLVLFAAPHAFAWGEKGHYIVNEAATHGLPNDMPHFFYRAFGDLVWLGFDPDRWRNSGESVEPATAPNHFLDWEYVDGLKLSPSRYVFIDTMYTSGRLRQRGITNAEAGFLPWAIAEEAQKLTAEFRVWRAAPAGTFERASAERNIITIAGALGHYIGDGANPHHATMNYNGWAIMPNPNNYPVDCGTHSRFESQFVSHAVDVSMVIPKVAAPVLRTDYFASAIEHVKASNALTEHLYRIDRDGAFSPYGKPSPIGIEFATDRLAVGASLLRDIWWSAWKNSERRPTRSGD